MAPPFDPSAGRPEHRRALFLSALMALTTSACGSSDPVVTRCTTNADCVDGQCIDGMCMPNTDAGPETDGGLDASTDAGTDSGLCTSSDDCPMGRCLATGECIEGGPDCTDDTECGGDRYCCADGCAVAGEGFCLPYGTGPRGDVNDACMGVIPVGVFEASVQCEWTAPPDGDEYPGHTNVLTSPLVADLANAAGEASGEILINTYNFTDGGAQAARGDNPAYFGVLRILSGQDCTQLETIHSAGKSLIGAAPPAIGDLDGDGTPEIVALTAGSGLVAFRWDADMGRHVEYWVSSGEDIAGLYRWDGPAIHDLDDDGIPEVLSRGEVFNGRTGERINVGQTGITSVNSTGAFPVVADVDGDGHVELASDQIYRWDRDMNLWVVAYPGGGADVQQHAVADFGTPGADAASFDPSTLDGTAEIVTISGGIIRVQTLAGDIVLQTANLNGNGPPTVGDFDNDGLPEIAMAGATRYSVVDFDCEVASDECEGGYVRWSAASQDASSARTGSSIFDFEGDGQAEVVYPDECFTRIYDGRTGDVLYSAFRTSCTWYENAVVADPDKDENTEIVVGSNTNCNVTCPLVDPIHPGLRCEDGDDCGSGRCEGGLCRCADDTECDSNTSCVAPLEGGGDNVCRAIHPADAVQTGVRVLRDSLDRWVSSRPIWNQHTYSITNVGDDGSIPATSVWAQNHADADMNNYRQNAQGIREPGALPDITGRLDSDICREEDGEDTLLVSTVCNRGGRAVGAALPATFYLGPPEEGNVLCTSYTSGPVPVGGCLEVSCELTMNIEDATVYVRVNDDGAGGATTIECNDANNGDQVAVDRCDGLI